MFLLYKTLIYLWRSGIRKFRGKGGPANRVARWCVRVAGNESGSGQRRGDREREGGEVEAAAAASASNFAMEDGTSGSTPTPTPRARGKVLHRHEEVV